MGLAERVAARFKRAGGTDFSVYIANPDVLVTNKFIPLKNPGNASAVKNACGNVTAAGGALVTVPHGFATTTSYITEGSAVAAFDTV